MKQFFRDAAGLLGFPWSKPAEPTTKATSSSGFSETITDTDREGMFERNQTAHAIIADVATDSVTDFNCTLDDEVLEEFTVSVKTIFQTFISKSLIHAYLSTRLYGYSGILMGYADGDNLENEASGTSEIIYLQAIPKTWIKEVVKKKDKNGNITLPVEIDHYSVDIGGKTQNIHATRLIHLTNFSLKEENLEGESNLDCIFDDLTILKSMTWGTGQAVWRHGGGLNVFTAPEDSSDEQAQINAIADITTNINVMTSLAMPAGTKLLSPANNTLNPKEYFDACLAMISIGSRIPISILRGSVAGSLTASEKDRKDYYELLNNIQKEHLTPALTKILKCFQASGQLQPSEQEFIIDWERTPIWMLEEQRGKKLQAETEQIELQTELLKSQGSKQS